MGKRLTSLLLITAILMAALAGCSQSAEGPENEGRPSQSAGQKTDAPVIGTEPVGGSSAEVGGELVPDHSGTPVVYMTTDISGGFDGNL